MRCFVGCWPDSATRERLDQWARDAHRRHPGARRVPAGNLHLTLAFIGELAPPRAHELARALADEATAAFAWRIDRTGGFERSRVVWAGGPEQLALTQLAERVRQRLRALHIGFDSKPFAAHITLLRDVPARVTPSEPLQTAGEGVASFVWSIDGAQLLVSERDSQRATRYRVLAPE